MKQLVIKDKDGNDEQVWDMPEEAIRGLIKAIEDVKAGRYTTISSEDLCSACCHERGKHTKNGCQEIVSNGKKCDCNKFKLNKDKDNK